MGSDPIDMAEPCRPLGEALLQLALTEARRHFGERLHAAFALGSLAHGGFSAHVSDVDVALILADPLQAEDAMRVEAVNATVKTSGWPLADRLSIFWGTRETLARRAQGGRFPPLDCLDLKQNGRLLEGEDVRDVVHTPSTEEMIVAAARMSLANMATPEVMAQLREPSALVRSGVRPFTKRVLFPVRFVYTARTGKVGTNHDAAAFFSKEFAGPAATLAERAYGWRNQPYEIADSSSVQAVVHIAREGLLPLYRLYVEDYAPRLEACGQSTLARGMREWRERLRE